MSNMTDLLVTQLQLINNSKKKKNWCSKDPAREIIVVFSYSTHDRKAIKLVVIFCPSLSETGMTARG